MTAAAPASYEGKTDKAGQTRARILDAALTLVRDQGYERATMRAIAARARVSLGSAYYYFPSKDHLIQAYYAQGHEEHLRACVPILARERTLQARLEGVLRAQLGRGDHPFAVALFRSAADPASPLSPFSPESGPVRSEAVDLMRRVLDASNAKVPASLAAELPMLLWLYQMGLILFWVHDRSPKQRQSYRLLERTCPMVCRMIRIAALPPVRPLTRATVRLVQEIRELGAPDAAVQEER